MHSGDHEHILSILYTYFPFPVLIQRCEDLANTWRCPHNMFCGSSIIFSPLTNDQKEKLMIYGPLMSVMVVWHTAQSDLAGWYVGTESSTHQHPDSAIKSSVFLDNLIEIPFTEGHKKSDFPLEKLHFVWDMMHAMISRHENWIWLLIS